MKKLFILLFAATLAFHASDLFAGTDSVSVTTPRHKTVIIPVSLSTWKVSINNGMPVLSWTADSLIPGLYYVVERSLDVDPKIWSVLRIVRSQGEAGSADVHEFVDFTDIHPMTQYFYRLREVYPTGTVAYSEMQWINTSSGSQQPIVVGDRLSPKTISFSGEVTKNTRVELQYLTGNIPIKTLTIDSVTHLLPLEDLPKGTYLLKIFEGNKQTNSVRLTKK